MGPDGGKVSDQELTRILNEIVKVEGPLHIELAAHRLAYALGFQRVGNRVREAVNRSIRNLLREEAIKRVNKFLWPNKDDFNLVVRQPLFKEKESYRPIKFVSPEEIELAIKNLICAALSIPEEDIIREVARIFGFDRIGANISDRLKKIIHQMISRGDLVFKGDRISLP